MKMKLLGVLAFLLAAATTAYAKDSVELKVASLAPKGSVWEKLLTKAGKDIEKKTDGRVTVTFFFTGQQGDERESVRKMKLKELDGAAITAVGLGLIKGDVRVLELPFMFKTEKQLDYVRDKMSADFEAQFDSAGYVLLAWGDVGWSHLYTNIEIKTKEDLLKTKIWAWTDDPIVKTLFANLGIKGVPLGVPDVLPNLKTGTIDACYGSPVAAVALQWFSKVKYATSMHLTYSIGAIVLTKDSWKQISSSDQEIIKGIAKSLDGEMKKAVRKENKKAKKAMENAGIKFVETPAALQAEMEKEAKKVWDELAGKLYDKALLEKVKKYAAEGAKK